MAKEFLTTSESEVIKEYRFHLVLWKYSGLTQPSYCEKVYISQGKVHTGRPRP